MSDAKPSLTRVGRKVEGIGMSSNGLFCPCGSGLLLSACCKPIIDSTARAKTAEALMRSRYTAYALRDIDHLEVTLDRSQLSDFDKNATAMWARDTVWVGLKILKTSAGSSDDKNGTVEFKAYYKRDGVVRKLHELSYFRKVDDAWLYSRGVSLQRERDASKIDRNEFCPCGSGKKYKKCCAR